MKKGSSGSPTTIPHRPKRPVREADLAADRLDPDPLRDGVEIVDLDRPPEKRLSVVQLPCNLGPVRLRRVIDSDQFEVLGRAKRDVPVFRPRRVDSAGERPEAVLVHQPLGSAFEVAHAKSHVVDPHQQ